MIKKGNSREWPWCNTNDHCLQSPIDVPSCFFDRRGRSSISLPDRLTPGLKTETVTIVDDTLVVKHMGGDGVLSTPSMIALMERASIQAVQDYLPEGHTTVGFEVHVKHFGATPKGKKVTVHAELIEVDARKLRFKVEAHDEDKKVGDGTHRRAIIAIQRQG
jgi:fluoroacetyl-CoA thioesterase